MWRRLRDIGELMLGEWVCLEVDWELLMMFWIAHSRARSFKL